MKKSDLEISRERLRDVPLESYKQSNWLIDTQNGAYLYPKRTQTLISRIQTLLEKNPEGLSAEEIGKALWDPEETRGSAPGCYARPASKILKIGESLDLFDCKETEKGKKLWKLL